MKMSVYLYVNLSEKILEFYRRVPKVLEKKLSHRFRDSILRGMNNASSTQSTFDSLHKEILSKTNKIRFS